MRDTHLAFYRGIVASGGLAACLAIASPASAEIIDIKFCNDYPERVYFAIAYPQKDGSWMSRGWARLDSRTCGYFDTALHVSIFYYRAVSDARPAGRRRTVREVWGTGEGSFHVLPNYGGMFTFYNATKAETTGGAQQFTKFFSKTNLTADGDVKATVTIDAQGNSTSSVAFDPPPVPPPPSSSPQQIPPSPDAR